MRICKLEDPYCYWIYSTLGAYEILIDQGIDFSKAKKELESLFFELGAEEVDRILENEGLWMSEPWICLEDIIRAFNGWVNRGLYSYTNPDDTAILQSAVSCFKALDQGRVEEND